MKLLVVFRKTLRELGRDWLILSLTLTFAPFFVFLYWLFTFGGSTTYTVLVINLDQPVALADGAQIAAGEQSTQAIEAVRYADGNPLLKVNRLQDKSQVEHILRNRGAAAYVLFPEDFSRTLVALQSGDRSVTTRIEFGGDLTNPYYVIAASLAITAVDSYAQQATGQQPILGYVEKPLGASAARSEFETYVPGVFLISVILLIFPAAMQTAREVESRALRRLRLTPLTSFEYLGGITLTLVLVGIASIILTFFVAVALGFRSQGPLWVAVLIGAVTSLSIIGMSLVVACFSRTVSQAFVIANFPMALLMFFSGSIFPIPKVVLFTLGGKAINLYDLLPPTHGVAALNKVLTLGAGLDEVVYELVSLIILSILYFVLGVWLFQRTQMRRQ